MATQIGSASARPCKCAGRASPGIVCANLGPGTGSGRIDRNEEEEGRAVCFHRDGRSPAGRKHRSCVKRAKAIRAVG